ncbi:MAG: helix-turn-helix domain-containing protein, partial [Thermoanaerobaculia bacterium]
MATAKWIRDRRAAAGLTQAELARKVGASQPLISLWERGTSEPPPELLKKLRTVLDGKQTKKKDKAAKRDDLELHVKLWAVADRLRGPLAPADYKHVVLG